MTDYQFDPRLNFARTIPSCYYFGAETLEAENCNVFGKTWQLAGRGHRNLRNGAAGSALIDLRQRTRFQPRAIHHCFATASQNGQAATAWLERGADLVCMLNDEPTDDGLR